MESKEVSIEEFIKMQQQAYIEKRDHFAPLLIDRYINQEWEEFINMALAVWEVMPIAFDLYDRVPDKYKYDFCIQAYIHHGDSIPAVRKAVRGALKYGKPTLPPEIAAQESITVYRAGEEPINLAKYRISWTTSKDVALFFLNTYGGRHASHLYKGTLKTSKIIAYVDDRDEKEVMQYANVHDIEDITPTFDE